MAKRRVVNSYRGISRGTWVKIRTAWRPPNRAYGTVVCVLAIDDDEFTRKGYSPIRYDVLMNDGTFRSEVQDELIISAVETPRS